MAANCVGLDIGSNAVKVVQVKQTRRGVQLLNFGIEPVPLQSIVDGSVMNTSDLAEAIRALFAKLRIRQKDVSIAVAHSVIIKKITVPSLTREMLDEQIYWEAEQHISFAKDDVELDYEILESRPAQNQMDILLVAAKKELIGDYAALVREARLNPVTVDVAAFALQNCFELSYGKMEGTVALLNIGASLSTINIIEDGITAFTRDVTVGGNAFTDEIQRQLAVGYEEAEAYKCGGAAGDELVPHEVDAVIERQAETLAGELQRSFDFYLATTSAGQIDRLYLSGGSARVPALRQAIETRARIPLEVFDPFRQVIIDESKFDIDYIRAQAPMAAVAVGLALRSEGDSL